ncbi:MAG: hypothetical protein GEU75_15585 [Dehalococcoidia bacterium]|nr:hypothetical protein [Dehalococcoidia bacterium]
MSYSKLMTKPFRALAAALAAITLLVAAGTPASVWADSSATNNESVAQSRLAQMGVATSMTGGSATAGPALAFDNAIVSQINVQAVAGGPQTEALSTQTATNNATINQTTASESGDATGSNGGIASSGNARAGSLAIVQQLNVQVIACPNATEPINQTASNDATIDQTTLAASGDAAADGSGSTASSGDASARSVAFVQQRNVQVYVCRPGSAGASDQTAGNVANVAQETLAASGDADASNGGNASSGRGRSNSSSQPRQGNTQVAID